MTTTPTSPLLLDLHQTTLALLELAYSTGGKLPCSRPWRLDGHIAQVMAKRGYRAPEGGWGPCIALLAAAGIFHSEEGGFVACLTPEAFLTRFTSPGDVQRVMIEAWTRALVPPTLAAGLFLLLGLHPYWGLKVAGSVHTTLVQHEPLMAHQPHKRCEFDDPTVVSLTRIVFDLMESMLSVLRGLDAHTLYAEEVLGESLWPYVLRASERLKTLQAGCIAPGQLPLLVGEAGLLTTKARCRTWCEDLMHELLLPAELATRLPDGRFCVHHDVLFGEGVRVFKTPEVLSPQLASA